VLGLIIIKIYQHKAAGRKTRLDIQNYGCNGNLLWLLLLLLLYCYYYYYVHRWAWWRARSACCWTTVGGRAGVCVTAPELRRWCLQSASTFHHPTRTLRNSPKRVSSITCTAYMQPIAADVLMFCGLSVVSLSIIIINRAKMDQSRWDVDLWGQRNQKILDGGPEPLSRSGTVGVCTQNPWGHSQSMGCCYWCTLWVKKNKTP